MATIWALADLHLSGGDDKPMDIFGPEWKDHPDKIMQGWQSNIKDHDLTIIPGDISWAMQLEGARDDLNWIAALPGRKVLVRGNHDYWWKSISRVRA
ncbi:MAG: serine/threonine protein phosphatase, partial [Firmicutes bacterium]|nr:serine/threonine protein phosphatase [Bacillota bacterium]